MHSRLRHSNSCEDENSGVPQEGIDAVPFTALLSERGIIYSYSVSECELVLGIKEKGCYVPRISFVLSGRFMKSCWR